MNYLRFATFFVNLICYYQDIKRIKWFLADTLFGSALTKSYHILVKELIVKISTSFRRYKTVIQQSKKRLSLFLIMIWFLQIYFTPGL